MNFLKHLPYQKKTISFRFSKSQSHLEYSFSPTIYLIHEKIPLALPFLKHLDCHCPGLHYHDYSSLNYCNSLLTGLLPLAMCPYSLHKPKKPGNVLVHVSSHHFFSPNPPKHSHINEGQSQSPHIPCKSLAPSFTSQVWSTLTPFNTFLIATEAFLFFKHSRHASSSWFDNWFSFFLVSCTNVTFWVRLPWWPLCFKLYLPPTETLLPHHPSLLELSPSDLLSPPDYTFFTADMLFLLWYMFFICLWTLSPN